MKKFNLFRNITGKMMLVFFLVIMVPLYALVFFSFRAAENILIDKVSISARGTLEKTADSMGTVFDNMVYVSEIINLSDSIEYAMTVEDPLNRVQTWFSYQVMENTFTFINSTFFPYQNYLTLLGTNDMIFTSWPRTEAAIERIKNADWYNDIERDSFVWIPAMENYLTQEINADSVVFTLARRLQYTVGGESFGSCIISLPHSELLNLLARSATFENSELFFLDNNGTPVLHTSNGMAVDTSAWHMPGESGSFRTQMNGEYLLVNYYHLNRSGWVLAEAIPYASILEEIGGIRHMQTAALVAFLFIFVVISVIFSRSFSRPVKGLVAGMEQVKQGDFTVRIPSSAKDEIGLLANGFNHMVAEIDTLVRRIYRQQRKERDLEIKMLQNQMHPHFLFNTLNSIRWVSVMSGAENVGNMIGMLNDLLKRSMSPARLIRVEEELESTANYAGIQKIRFNGRFTLEIDADAGTLRLYTLKFILQPIVENAILHGVDKLSSGSVIRITGELDGDVLSIKVSDNGKGMNRETLEALKASLKQDRWSGGGIGLYNVQQRIVYNYGRAYGLTVQSEEGAGTQVEVRLPFLEKGDGEAEVEDAKNPDC